jgi:hypothetical protein
MDSKAAAGNRQGVGSEGELPCAGEGGRGSQGLHLPPQGDDEGGAGGSGGGLEGGAMPPASVAEFTRALLLRSPTCSMPGGGEVSAGVCVFVWVWVWVCTCGCGCGCACVCSCIFGKCFECGLGTCASAWVGCD